jgi:hypothetical protein
VGTAGFAEHGIPAEGDAGALPVKLICKAAEGVPARLGRVIEEFQMVISHVVRSAISSLASKRGSPCMSIPMYRLQYLSSESIDVCVMRL